MLASATVDRPLLLRQRRDLVVREQWFAGQRHFVLHDPLALTYAYLTEIEHAVWALLDGRTSSAEVLAQFAARYAPRQLTQHELQSFLGQLHRQGLVVSDAPGQGTQLAERHERKERFNLLRLAEKVLALRWRGINPQRLLDWLEPKLGWLFSGWAVALWTAIVAWAAVLAATHASELARRLPDARAWLSGGNLLWLSAALILVKTLHELGHALAARRVGCRCREIGVQLFFLLPCLYTNVSDVWLVPSKWRRMAVSAAGIYVELLLAAIAMLIWWQAEPGVLSSLCFNVMLVASVGTLVLNGNPLLRYDGYYLLSDLVEVPNLEQTSRQQLQALLTRWCLGADLPRVDQFSWSKRLGLAVYAAAALAYRAVLLVGIYFALRSLLAPYRLQPLGDVLLALAVMGMVVPLAIGAGQSIGQARRRRELSPLRLGLTAAILLGLLLAACYIPLPQRLAAPAVIEPQNAVYVYVTVPGTLVSALTPGAAVERGQTIAQLASPELERDHVRLVSEAERQRLHIAALEAGRGDDPAALAALPAARQSLADLQQRLTQVRELIGRLRLTAPQDGIVLPPPQQRHAAKSQQLDRWLGTPLEPANRGSFLESGTLACIVAQPGQVEALAVVQQGDVPLVQSGSSVSIAIPQHPQGALRGVIESVSQIDAAELPIHLTAAGLVPQKLDAQGRPQALDTVYQVRIALDRPPPELRPGATCQVLLTAAPQTLAARLSRWLGQTFRFRRA